MGDGHEEGIEGIDLGRGLKRAGVEKGRNEILIPCRYIVADLF